ncbi:MAG: T9SS type A sorting domain-containing protein [Fidelibacterota bacterium]|nr:MAG: T9SS type A sorting domain-containing protein [Candidatus Neomarinimicrobiota bacterium]
MKCKLGILTASTILAIIAVFWLILPVDQSAPVSVSIMAISSPRELQSELVRQQRDAEPGSPEAERISRAIANAHRRIAGKKERAENPSAFLEALAAIKTAHDGTVYAPNYLVDQLEHARQRRTLKKGGSRTAIEWTERGPGNINGRARAVIADAADASGNTWFAASVGGGVWKTTDAGATWQNKTPDLTTLSTTTLAQCASDPDVMYVGTGMGYGRIADLSGSGIWKSTDHGETWFQLESTANGELLDAINRIVVDPDDADNVLVCSNDAYTSISPRGGIRISGIFRSTDGGGSWTQVYDPDSALGTATDNRIQQIIANPGNFRTLYASVNEVGVIKSTDGGRTWFVSADDFALPDEIGIGEGSYRGVGTRIELAISPTDTARLYAAVDRISEAADLYMSMDAGGSWILMEDTGDDFNWFNVWGRAGPWVYSAGWFDNTIIVHPFDPNIVYVGGIHLHRITINEAHLTRTMVALTWMTAESFLDPTIIHVDQHFLATIPVDETTGSFRMLVANDGGVAHSPDNGVTWTQHPGMGTMQFYGMDKKPGENVYIGGTQDNGSVMSQDNPDANSAWRRVLGGDGGEPLWHYTNPSLLMGGTQVGNLYRSENGGEAWARVPETTSEASPFVYKLATNKSDPDMVFTICSDGVWRSDDFGLTWTLTSIPDNWVGYRPFDNVEVSQADPQVVWISSSLKEVPSIPSALPWPSTVVPQERGGVHVSTDGGLSFTEVSQNIPANMTEPSGIGTHPADLATAYLLFAAPGNPKVLRTTDLGQTWEDISGFESGGGTSDNGFPDVSVFSLIVMPYDTDIIWAGTEIGLFISENGGESWDLADNGCPQVSIFQLSIVDDQVLVSTYGRGLWTASIPELSGYKPPVVTKVPRVRLSQHPTGYLRAAVELRSPYDSTVVRLNGQWAVTIGATHTAMDTALMMPILEAGRAEATVTSYKDGRVYATPDIALDVFQLGEVQANFATRLNTSGAADNFIGEGFVIQTPDGFESQAIHSPHPYEPNSGYSYMLRLPIQVAESNAYLHFHEIVLIEEGVDEHYTQANFFDYVIVEGSADGMNWEPLVEGYDSRADPDWSAAYRSGLDAGLNSSTRGDPSLYRNRSIDLSDTFESGETIFIRFRLYADSGAEAWGWAVDNIAIQRPAYELDDPDNILKEGFSLAQNYPNPFNEGTAIGFELLIETDVTLAIFDLAGREVSRLVDGPLEARYHEYTWWGVSAHGTRVPSGIYFALLSSQGTSRSIKMVLLK